MFMHMNPCQTGIGSALARVVSTALTRELRTH